METMSHAQSALIRESYDYENQVCFEKLQEGEGEDDDLFDLSKSLDEIMDSRDMA